MNFLNYFWVVCLIRMTLGRPQESGTPENCDSVADEGYSCVEESQCQASVCIPGSDFQKQGTGGFDCGKNKDHVEAVYYDCIDRRSTVGSQKVCCHSSLIGPAKNIKPDIRFLSEETSGNGILQEKQIQGTCRSVESEGYRCVEVDQCKASSCLQFEANTMTLLLGPDPTAGTQAVRSGLDTSSSCDIEKNHLDALNFECFEVKNNQQLPKICCHESLISKSLPVPTSDSRDNAPTPTDGNESCGVHLTNGFNIRSFGIDEGANTEFAEWPHTCALFKDGNFIGGASLIASGLILTAAHKVEDVAISSLMVRCGEWDLTARGNKAIEVVDHQEIGVITSIIHPSFESDLLTNNMAILQMKTEFKLGTTVGPVCLPSGPNVMEDVDTTECYATGWGKPVKENATTFASLKQVKLPIVDKSSCEKGLASNRAATYSLDPSNICAGGKKDQDTCSGDGGGPLFCKQLKSSRSKDRYVQVGITSWGKQCGVEDVPGVYSSIEYNLCFIDAITKCLVGNKYSSFYNYSHCNDWFIKETERIKSRLEARRKRFEEFKEESLSKKIAGKALDKAQKSLDGINKISNEICSDM